MKTKRKIADVYIRLSTKKQEDGMSKETQEKECQKYCEEHGIFLRKIYYENKSGITPYNRPVFYEMIANQQTKDKADIIICFCANRLTRNHVDFYPIKSLVDDHGTKIIFVKENITIEKPFKAHEEFLIDIIVASSKFEVNHMNEIRKKGLIERAKTGIKPTKMPYGYKMLKRKVVIIPEQAIFVKKAFELYSSGKYSLATLPNELYEQGFKYKLQADGKIPKATLACMLKNMFYTGFYTYPGVENIIKGKHKPIIEQDLYN